MRLAAALFGFRRQPFSEEPAMSIKLLGHSVHPMLVSFPIGLLGASVVFDLVYLATQTGRWAEISFWLIAGGVVTGLIAAPFGSLDWLAISSGTRAKRIGLLHGGTAVSAVLLFAASWWLRYDAPTSPGTLPIALSLLGIAFLAVAGWLGGELVERLGIGVHPGANPNSPSSLATGSTPEPPAPRATESGSRSRAPRPIP
jgi:uncharacterized membrane protein